MNTIKLAGLEPADVLGYFEQICSMPHGSGNTKIITMPDAYIKTKKVSEWKKEGLVIGKRPCVFLLLA